MNAKLVPRCVALSLLVLGPALGGGVPTARAETAETPPFAGSLARVPVGSWALYRTAYFSGNAAQDVRFALVEKKADRSVWEMTMSGPDGKPLVVQTTVAVARGVPGEVTSRVMQLGDDSPMRIERAAPLPGFRVAGKSGRDPRERVTVLAGAYTCGRVKETLGPGRGQDFWVEPRVHPLGVVKFEEWTQGGNGVRLVQRTWELMETGRGARRIITRPPRPFESDAFRKLMKP